MTLRTARSDSGSISTSIAPSWTLTHTSQDTPRQHNGYDCGVFATFCAHYVSVGAAPAFDQADIPQLRERMMLDILNKQLHS